MLSGKAVLLLFLFSGAPRHFPLPPSAEITIGPVQSDPKDPAVQQGACKAYHLTQKQVREEFRTYHKLRPLEFENYLYLPCWIDGTIKIDGKTYTWRSRMGNLLETTWPDGTWKTLGGKYTDDPSEGEK